MPRLYLTRWRRPHHSVRRCRCSLQQVEHSKEALRRAFMQYLRIIISRASSCNCASSFSVGRYTPLKNASNTTPIRTPMLDGGVAVTPCTTCWWPPLNVTTVQGVSPAATLASRPGRVLLYALFLVSRSAGIPKRLAHPSSRIRTRRVAAVGNRRWTWQCRTVSLRLDMREGGGAMDSQTL